MKLVTKASILTKALRSISPIIERGNTGEGCGMSGVATAIAFLVVIAVTVGALS